jgi:hypothetical protein
MRNGQSRLTIVRCWLEIPRTNRTPCRSLGSTRSMRCSSLGTDTIQTPMSTRNNVSLGRLGAAVSRTIAAATEVSRRPDATLVVGAAVGYLLIYLYALGHLAPGIGGIRRDRPLWSSREVLPAGTRSDFVHSRRSRVGRPGDLLVFAQHGFRSRSRQLGRSKPRSYVSRMAPARSLWNRILVVRFSSRAFPWFCREPPAVDPSSSSSSESKRRASS